MGLPKSQSRNKYTALLMTFGPVDRQDDPIAQREALLALATTNGVVVKPGQFDVAFEEGTEDTVVPYNHCHLVMGYALQRKPPMKYLNACKKLCYVDSKGRRPNGQFNHVPTAFNTLPYGGVFGYLKHYLYTPKKSKICDPDLGTIEWEPIQSFPPIHLRPKGEFYWDLTWKHLPSLKAEVRSLVECK